MSKKSAKPTFGDRLKRARLDQSGPRGGHFSPEKLAEELGVSGQTVRNWESGTTEPNLEMMKAIAKALGTAPGFLAFGERTYPSGEHPVIEVDTSAVPVDRHGKGVKRA